MTTFTHPLLAPVSTYVIPTREVDLHLPLLRNLADRLGKDVTIYDLESTTLLDRPTFGITESAIMRIPRAGGRLRMACDLVNPENPIDPKVVELNGITQDMVDGQPTFAAWIPTFRRVAAETLAFGYNSTSFDGPAVSSQAERYGSEVVFDDTLDLRQRWVELVSDTGNGRKGKLGEVLQTLGITIDDGWHRAGFDVVATAMITEKILEHYGIHGLLKRRLHAIPTATTNPTTIKAELTPLQRRVYEDISQAGYDARRIAKENGLSINQVCDAAWDLFHRGSLRIEEIAEPEVQSLLKPVIKDCAARAWTSDETMGRLKPVLQEVRGVVNQYVDYTQLKVALTFAGLR